ncbi:MAG: M3 family oligoendopeptidase [Chloroflexi bacterium]|nr:M3 family oligoendopeptidase [Chloroflexota bacterium]
MFDTLPMSFETLRQFTWADFQRYYDALAARPLDASTVTTWLADWTRLNDAFGEVYSRLSVATTQNTADAESEALMKRFFAEVLPPADIADQKLREKFIASGLQPEGMAVPIRNMRAEIENFREENVAIETEINNLRLEFNKVIGAQTTTWKGETRTLRQMEPVLQSQDRAERESVWRAISTRQLQDREALNTLWGEFLRRRIQVAKNAGHPDYRSFMWKERLRFDYTPDDNQRFLDAIAEVVVPAATKLYEKRRQQLGVETLRPWDLSVDPLGREPLRPFENVEELEDRAATIFERLDPELATYYGMMRDDSLLDLGNRENKGPGGYCTAFPASKRPFIFMNAVGLHGDIRTLIHEAGHAFHAFEKLKLPYSFQRNVTAEFNEVASMAMELLTFPYWSREEGGYYSTADANRARVEHLEKVIHFWPYMSVVDGFQHWAYTHPEAAADPIECDLAWTRLWDRFEPYVDYTGLEADKADGWHRKLHIYLYPFYYVDYGMAQLGALQVWMRMRSDHAGALAAYKRALALGGTATLPELYSAAGARFEFTTETLGEAVNLIMETIEELEG